MRIINQNCVRIIDPSELLRPEFNFADKPIGQFRDYSINENDPIKERIRKTYYDMHTNQTVDFVKGQHKKWRQFSHYKGTVRQALEKLNDLIDESDPDTDVPNIVHAFQTAERIREDYPDEDWFHLTGLIHDLGKIMAFYNEPQWAVVGDTFVVGCEWSDNIVYRETSFVENPDGNNKKYNTKYGMYKPSCGIDNVMMSWGHDEYFYHVLKNHGATLPEQAMAMIRYHSFYPWHLNGDYKHLENNADKQKKEWVQKFNKYDLYTKSAVIPDIESLWPYYESLIEKYIPGIIDW